MNEIVEYCDLLSKIEYGWFDKKGNHHPKIDSDYMLQYRLQSNEETLKHMVGVCWEITELGRDYFTNRGIQCKTIFVVVNKFGYYHCHSFVIFTLNQKYYWFEATWKGRKGVHEFNSEKEIIDFVINNFNEICQIDYDSKWLEVWEYKKPKENCGCVAFYANCYKGNRIR